MHPRFAGWGLAVAEALLDGPREVAVVGPPTTRHGRPAPGALLGTAPGAVVAVGEPGADGSRCSPTGRWSAGAPAAYVCRHFVCDAPTTDPAALAATLGARMQV